MKVAGALVVVVALALGALFALYRAGWLQANDPDPYSYPWVGIDVSHHQGQIDWGAVATSGMAFAFIKASEGRDFRDRRFAENWRGAKAAGIARGAYHYFTFCSPGDIQAAHFLSVAPPEPGTLPPVADVEFVGNCERYGDLAAVREQVRVFLARVESAWGRKPILYVTPDSLERVIGDDLTDYPIWIRSVFAEPAPDAYRGWLIWQFSDNARIPGIRGPVDQNTLRIDTPLDSLLAPRPRD